MSTFRFVHAADLHLGSPLSGLTLKDPEVAAAFAAASRAAFSDLVTHTLDVGAAFIVIAGDLYDGAWRDTSIGLFFNREVARLDRAGIPVFLLKGNHDADSIVTQSISLPDAVRQFSARRAGTFRLDHLKVALHGRSFADRAAQENLALSYPDAAPGWFNIGVLHTSCDGRPPHANYAPCTVQDLRGRGYDYWALGHVHTYEEVCRDPWIVYPGNLQGRNIRECGPKGAVLVEVADGRVTTVEPLIVDKARWSDISVDLSGAEDETAMLERVNAGLEQVVESGGGRLMAVRVHLVGTTRLHTRINADPRHVADEVQAAAHRRHSDIWIERVKITTAAPGRSGGGEQSETLDIEAMLKAIDADDEVRAEALAAIAAVTTRMPAGAMADGHALADDISELLAEARALVVGRARQAQA
jgi:DNA repair exonuclease SbcCD nuclease subunit